MRYANYYNKKRRHVNTVENTIENTVKNTIENTVENLDDPIAKCFI